MTSENIVASMLHIQTYIGLICGNRHNKLETLVPVMVHSSGCGVGVFLQWVRAWNLSSSKYRSVICCLPHTQKNLLYTIEVNGTIIIQSIATQVGQLVVAVHPLTGLVKGCWCSKHRGWWCTQLFCLAVPYTVSPIYLSIGLKTTRCVHCVTQRLNMI